MNLPMNRRFFLGLSAIGWPLILDGCAARPRIEVEEPQSPPKHLIDPAYQAIYAELPDERFPVPAVDLDELDPAFLRRIVDYHGPEQPGTIVIDPSNCYLFHVQDGGKAIRYGIGAGRAGFSWSGSATIQRKAEWPTWTPPKEMVIRDPKARPWAKGMPGGLDNPLGARAFYLYRNGRDTLYRIHGTNQPWTIGTNVSSGCIRMINQDVINLYRNVPIGTKVVVVPGANNC